MPSIDDYTISDEERSRYSPARYWDYLLGGYFNFEIDRKVAEKIMSLSPDIRLGALANRAFLRRAVRFMWNHGVTQFLDLGAGLPTVGPVHEVAQGMDPNSRTVYVDHDPVAITHSESILAGNPKTAVIEEDIRNMDKIFRNQKFKDLMDLQQPIGVLLVAVLHFIKDDASANEIIQVIRSRVPKGSFLAITHFTLENASHLMIEQFGNISPASSGLSKSRSREEIAGFFNGFELIEPGVVLLPLWRPEGEDEIFVKEPERALAYCGVGQKG
jgi:hypothetical protein